MEDKAHSTAETRYSRNTKSRVCLKSLQRNTIEAGIVVGMDMGVDHIIYNVSVQG